MPFFTELVIYNLESFSNVITYVLLLSRSYKQEFIAITFSYLQQFPQIDKEMVQVLKASLDHYQQLKLMEDMLKDIDQPKKKSTDTASPCSQVMIQTFYKWWGG